MSTVDSDPLIHRLAEGNTDAFSALYDRFAPSLYRIAWTLLRSRSDAEDAVQDVFLGLAQAGNALGRIQNLRAYLFSSLRHAAARIGSRRRVGATLPLDEDASSKFAVISDVGAEHDLFPRLERALGELPLEQREVVTLKIDGQLTFAEVAEVLGIPPNTAASRYRYALEKLRALLSEDAYATRTTSAEPS